MQLANTRFKSIDYWKEHKCASLEDVMDFARCLENIGFPVMPNWRVWADSEEESKPSLQKMLECPEYDLTFRNQETGARSGWIAAQMRVPLLAEMVAPEKWGKWQFEFNSYYDPDMYCDDELIEEYIFLRASFVLKEATGSDSIPWIYLRIPWPQENYLGNLVARCNLTGFKESSDLIRDMARSMRASCQLLSTENRRDNLYVQGDVGINNSKLSDSEREALLKALFDAANAVDLNAAANKDLGGFMASLKKCKEILSPIAAYAKQFTIHFIGHSHIDLAWKWRWPETIECMKGTLENQMALMEREKKYAYFESSAVIWKALQENHPETWARCREFIDKGQLDPQGVTWCEPDGMCIGPESWVRQIQYGQEAADECCGKKSTCGVNIDGFGFNAALPKIFKEAGIENFLTQKLRYNEYTIFPYIHFWWEGDDGSRILGLHIYPSHSNHIESDELSMIVRVFHRTDGVYNIPVMWGYGNHGGGPQPRMMDRIEELRGLTVFPTLTYISLNDYFNLFRTAEKEAAEKIIPVIKDELFLETHHKTYTVQGKVKEADRECERQLISIEALSAVAGAEVKEPLDEAWKVEMFNQFHDILTGTSFPCVYQDVFDDYGRAFEQIKTAKELSAEKILGKGNTAYVFNPLAWRRDAVVSQDGKGFGESGMLVDSRGNRTPYQKASDYNEIVFVAKDLPGLGFETYSQEKAGELDRSALKTGNDWAENGNMRVGFDPSRGVIDSMIIDGKEMAAGEIGALNLLEDTKFRDYETWNMGFTGREWEPKCTSFEKVEDGPVRVVFRAKYAFGQWWRKKPYFNIILWHTPAIDYPTSFFTQDFIIYSNGDRVECVLNADWWEDKLVVKVAAETSLKDTRAFYNVPFGALERPTKRETPWEKARFEVPALLWGDLEGKEEGLAILNRSRHGYDALGGRLRLTLLTSPWGDNKNLVSDPLADRGRSRIEYAFYPHKGGLEEAQMHRCAFEYEYPAVSLVGGESPAVEVGKSYLEVDPQELIVTAVKQDSKGKGIIVRGYEPYGNEVNLNLKGMLAGRNVKQVGMLEDDLKSSEESIKPHKIVTLRLS